MPRPSAEIILRVLCSMLEDCPNPGCHEPESRLLSHFPRHQRGEARDAIRWLMRKGYLAPAGGKKDAYDWTRKGIEYARRECPKLWRGG